MSTQTVLVIDDSSTIRKMVDSHLSQAGYRVVLAPTAEKGLELAPQLIPDIILLDHQLPGTTGIEVCKKIIAMPECRSIPFVVSSTLRKQAYVEYMDVANVVDSLPKPFKPELLKITIANALEVGAMIVSSQSDGTAVPEVVEEVSDSSLSGDFSWVSLREVLDFLNNGNKHGVLEVELEHDRVWFYLDQGRIQAVVSSSVTPEAVATKLPESLKELAPVLRFTMSSGFNSQVDGFVELLDRKVLDPRLLRTLLRFQAAYLTWQCFEKTPIAFSFSASRELPALFRRTPLQSSLAGILVEASMSCGNDENTSIEENKGWIRRGLRGQNLDRSGLGAKQLQLLTHLGTEPIATELLAEKVDLSLEETYRCLEGFRIADWVDVQTVASGRNLVALESNPEGSSLLREILADSSNPWSGKVVRDEFGLQLLVNRKAADYLLVEVTGEDELRLPKCLEGKVAELLATTPIGLIAPEEGNCPPLAAELSELLVIHRPYSYDEVLDVLNLLPESKTSSGKSSGLDMGELLSMGESK
ncbi:response regulator [Thalassoglobus sp.]|uniref:response regulator n=1 Tax=Thalassoglobus sp. TaxID=2795869 RepID=UPI003AA9545E